jgi:MFS family permease
VIVDLGSGALSDRVGRKWLIVNGMLVQAVALCLIPTFGGFAGWAVAAGLLGVGTAMVYPTLIAAVSDVAHPSWRSSAVGMYRMWRDSGYAIGALLAGVVADSFGLSSAIVMAGLLTGVSGLVFALRVPETLPGQHDPHSDLTFTSGTTFNTGAPSASSVPRIM